jgi:hypothetical protein
MVTGITLDPGDVAAVLAVVVSIFTLVFSERGRRNAEKRAKDAEDIASLLGENETVAFAALKLQTDGLPPNTGHRQLVLRAMMTACVFTSADRARAILYDVIDRYRNHAQYRGEIRDALDNVSRTFRAALEYDFPEPSDAKDKFDLSKGVYRLQLVETVFAGNKQALEVGKSGTRQDPNAASHCSRRTARQKREGRITRLVCLLCHRHPGTPRSG